MSQIHDYLCHGNLVAGASAEGHGALTEWTGRGTLTQEVIRLVLSDAGLPAEWAPPVKDAKVQLGVAVQNACAMTGLTAKPVRKVRNPDGTSPDAWLARWVIISLPVGTEATAGRAVGNIVLVATLHGDEESQRLDIETEPTDDPVRFANREYLRRQVRDHYEALTGNAVHQASDITKWLGLVLRKHLGAVRYGNTYYVPRAGLDTAEKLTNGLRSIGWGHRWMYPMLPVATSAQLSLGLAIGLVAEVDELAVDVEAARKAARDEGRLDVGAVAHKNAVARLALLVERIRGYEALLGEERFQDCLNRCGDFEVTLDEIAANVALSESDSTQLQRVA